jgi:GDP-D-mannose dehydratase
MGNAAKARKKLGWKPKYNIHKLIDDIIKNND